MRPTDEGISYYCSLYGSLVISVTDSFRGWDMSRRSGRSCLAHRVPRLSRRGDGLRKICMHFSSALRRSLRSLSRPLSLGCLPGRPGSFGCLEWSPLLQDTPKGFPPAGKLREAVMRGNSKENNYRGFGSPSSVTHGFAARATFPAKGEGSGWRQPKGFPLAGKLSAERSEDD